MREGSRKIMIPNMKIAPNSERERIQIFYDYGTKDYGIRQCTEIVRDGVYIETTKSICMTKEQLEKIINDAKTFIKER